MKPHETVRIQLPVRETGSCACSLSVAVSAREYFFHELFPAAEAASCLASIIRFSASSSDSILFRTEKGDRCAFR